MAEREPRIPLYRGQGNEPFIMSNPRSAAKRGQLVPYNVNGAPTGASGSAADTSFVPAGNIAATDVQAAIEELDAEKAASSHSHAVSDVTGLQAALDAKQQRGDPVILPEYTVATLPDVATFDNCAIIVSDEVGGRTIATSDGTNWRRVSDGAIVS